MSFSSVRTDALERLVKVAAAAGVSAGIGWLASPDVVNVVGTQNAVLVAAVLTPLLSALEKWLTQSGVTPFSPTLKQ